MKILVAYNCRSKASEKALDLAKMYSKAFDAFVHVVTSADSSKSEKDLPAKGEAENALWEAEQDLNKAGISCKTHLLIRGLSPGEDIVKFAKDNDIDQIIIGVEKKSRVGKFVMGSLAQYVILKASCPVLTVKSSEVTPDVFLGSGSMA